MVSVTTPLRIEPSSPALRRGEGFGYSGSGSHAFRRLFRLIRDF